MNLSRRPIAKALMWAVMVVEPKIPFEPSFQFRDGSVVL
jgi:hypothetical protein